MAVIVRSLPRAAAVLPRALAAAGVSVRAPAAITSPADHPAVRALLTVLTAATDGLDGERALTLVTGPIGRIDPVSLRGLRRSLRRREDPENPRQFGDLLVDVLTGETSRLPAAHAAALRRVRAVVAAAARRVGDDPRYALWQAWNRSGLQRRWLQARARGGVVGCAGGSRPRRCDCAFRHRRRLRGTHLGCDGPRPRRGRVHAETGSARTRTAHRAGRRRHRQRARGAGPGVGCRGHRGAPGRTVAQHRSPRRCAGHATACRRPRGCRRHGVAAERRYWPTSAGCSCRRSAGPGAGC